MIDTTFKTEQRLIQFDGIQSYNHRTVNNFLKALYKIQSFYQLQQLEGLVPGCTQLVVGFRETASSRGTNCCT